MNRIPNTVTPTAITLIIDGKTLMVHSGDERYIEVKDAIRNDNFDIIPEILDIKGRLISESNGGLYLLNGILRCDDYTIPALLGTRIIEMFKGGFDITPLTLFLQNLMSNPNESGSIVEEVYGFIEACNLPITADGHFLAYKMVRPNFTDIWSGRMDNSVGSVPEMNRADCDFNRNQTCSSGLHFCSEGYLGEYGTRSSSQVVVVKVNPRDVTSIPTDYDNAKGRACKYEIVDAISWDDIIKPWFTDEYSDEPEELFDDAGWEDTGEVEIPFDNARWEVRDNSDNELLKAFVTRQDARDYRGGNPFAYIWDNLNGEVVAGKMTYSPDGEDEEPEVEEAAPVNSSTKLNDKLVREIRTVLNDDAYDTIAELALMYNVSERTIRRIRDLESWKHVIV